MVVTLGWVRDNYDTIIKDRRIDEAEKDSAFTDWLHNNITIEEFTAVLAAHDNQTLLPDYDSTSHVISFNMPNGAKLEVDGVEAI